MPNWSKKRNNRNSVHTRREGKELLTKPAALEQIKKNEMRGKEEEMSNLVTKKEKNITMRF